jgi:3-deoxy-manno-octulosonate cytidylyltransferase (CMP-KDO synthetase)
MYIYIYIYYMIIGLIPARYASNRLNGKPLLKFGNFTMIQKVYIQTCKSKLINKVFVVTDDERIENSINDISGNTLLITNKCLNGTERLCLAIKKYKSIFVNTKIIVNIQGDEPFIDPNNIDIAIKKYINSKNINVKCSTLHYKITNKNELTNKNIGKLVLDKNNHILYCSRNCIPSNKKNTTDITTFNYYAHIGLFVFDINFLINNFMKNNTPLQIHEDIEWLKILEDGFKIVSSCVNNYEIGVNTYDDYNYLINKYY